MLAIRLQRTGRSGYAQYRVIVQESRKSPTSGKVVKHLGHFNPHTKEVVINKELAEFYLKNGAQPSNRVVRLLESEGVVLPAWVKKDAPKERTIKNPEKLRVNRPKEETPKAEEQAKEPAAEVATETPAEEPASTEATDAEAEK